MLNVRYVIKRAGLGIKIHYFYRDRLVCRPMLTQDEERAVMY